MTGTRESDCIGGVQLELPEKRESANIRSCSGVGARSKKSNFIAQKKTPDIPGVAQREKGPAGDPQATAL